ncbi:hypothetical protein DIPPA_14099 [Diplonema papillatum]|nr:hypothetical protein DIPPA_14099 [Diplonema papillatum]
MQKCARVTLTAHSQAGSLWGGKPVVAADGTVVVVQQDGVGKGEATCVGWDPVEKGRLAFGDSRGNVFVATLRGNRYSLLHRCGHAVVALAWSPAKRGEVVVSLCNRTILVLNCEKEGKVGHTLRSHQNRVHRLRFSPPHQALLCSASSDSVAVWTTPYTPLGSKSGRFEVKYSLKTAAYPPVDVAITSQYLVTCHVNALCVWDLCGPALVKEIPVPTMGDPDSHHPPGDATEGGGEAGGKRALPAIHQFDAMCVTPGGQYVVAGGRGSPCVVVVDLTRLCVERVVQVAGLPGVGGSGSGVADLKCFRSPFKAGKPGDGAAPHDRRDKSACLLAVVTTEGGVFVIDAFGHTRPRLVCAVKGEGAAVHSVEIGGNYGGDQYLAALTGRSLRVVHLPTARLFGELQAGDPTPSSETTLLNSCLAAAAKTTVPAFLAPAFPPGGLAFQLSRQIAAHKADMPPPTLQHTVPLRSALSPVDDWIKPDLKAAPASPSPVQLAIAGGEAAHRPQSAALQRNTDAGKNLDEAMFAQLYQPAFTTDRGGGAGPRRGAAAGALRDRTNGNPRGSEVSLKDSAAPRKRRAALRAAAPGLGRGEASAVTDPTMRTDVDDEFQVHVDLDDKALSLNTIKLRRLLFSFGRYPDKYRGLIWRFSLRLPTSAVSSANFSALLDKGRHPGIPLLLQKYPLTCAKVGQMLERVLECLSHHCPAVSLTGWMPELLFPLVKSFGNNLKSAFEASLVYLLNWGKSFLADYPHYSYHSVLLLNTLLERLEPDTLGILRTNSCPVELYAWQPMTSIFTDLLSCSEWQAVMDHAFSNQPIWLFYFHVAYLASQKKVLATCKGEEGFSKFFQRNNPVNVNQVIQHAYQLARRADAEELLDRMPPECNAASYQELVLLPPDEPYPLISNFPQVALNAAVAERDRILLHEMHLATVKKNIGEIKRQLGDAESAHERKIQELHFKSEAHEAALQAESERHQHMVEERERVLQEQTQLRLRRTLLQQKAASLELELASTKTGEALGRLNTGVADFSSALQRTAVEALGEDLLLRTEERAQKHYEHAVRWISDVPAFDDKYTDIAYQKGGAATASQHSLEGTRRSGSSLKRQPDPPPGPQRASAATQADACAANVLADLRLETAERGTATDSLPPPEYTQQLERELGTMREADRHHRAALEQLNLELQRQQAFFKAQADDAAVKSAKRAAEPASIFPPQGGAGCGERGEEGERGALGQLDLELQRQQALFKAQADDAAGKSAKRATEPAAVFPPRAGAGCGGERAEEGEREEKDAKRAKRSGPPPPAAAPAEGQPRRREAAEQLGALLVREIGEKHQAQRREIVRGGDAAAARPALPPAVAAREASSSGTGRSPTTTTTPTLIRGGACESAPATGVSRTPASTATPANPLQRASTSSSSTPSSSELQVFDTRRTQVQTVHTSVFVSTSQATPGPPGESSRVPSHRLPASQTPPLSSTPLTSRTSTAPTEKPGSASTTTPIPPSTSSSTSLSGYLHQERIDSLRQRYTQILEDTRQGGQVAEERRRRSESEADEGTRIMRLLEQRAAALAREAAGISTQNPDVSFAVSSLSSLTQQLRSPGQFEADLTGTTTPSPSERRNRDDGRWQASSATQSSSLPHPPEAFSAASTESDSPSQPPFHNPFLAENTPDTIDPSDASSHTASHSLVDLLALPDDSEI